MAQFELAATPMTADLVNKPTAVQSVHHVLADDALFVTHG